MFQQSIHTLRVAAIIDIFETRGLVRKVDSTVAVEDVYVEVAKLFRAL